MVGGNTEAVFQVKSSNKRNEIGERIIEWNEVGGVKGLLDYVAGQSDFSKYHAKVQETTHIFLCDYALLPKNITSENARVLIHGDEYEILLIDDPMEMHEHFEIYLKYIGGGQGAH